MDFDEAVNQALGPPEPPVETVEPPKKAKKERKRKEPVEEPPEKPKKARKHDIEEVDEEIVLHQQSLYNQLIRYCEAFPECADGIMVPQDAPPDEIEFQLATIQRRINAKNELGIMRAGLVTGCMLVEAGNDMVGSPVLLKGFGMSVQASAEQFDDVLKQVLCKYGGSFSLTCEATLGLLLMKHAATTHMVNMAEKVKKEKEEKAIQEIPEPPSIHIKDEPVEPPMRDSSSSLQ
jgi:hypothetical protein